METEGAKRVFKRSVEKHNLRYVKFLGNGDSKSYQTLKDTYPGIEVEKLECVGHCQKRIGNRSRKFKNREKGLGGRGKLIWERVPKTHYVSLTHLEFGVYDAVANLNIGMKASILIYEKLGMIPGVFTLKG